MWRINRSSAMPALAAPILHGALTAVLYNVDINLGSIRNEQYADSYRTSRAHLQMTADQRHAVIKKLMAEQLAD